MIKEYYSHGKLLITGEYLVLDGALALAVPTKFGQSLSVEETDTGSIYWNAMDRNNHTWFASEFSYGGANELFLPGSSPATEELRLQQILEVACKLNPGIIEKNRGYQINTKLDFDLNWGLGSSSTLIANIAKWFHIDPYQLLDKTFGGSGYDIAVAQSASPVTYQLHADTRSILKVNFLPSFKDKLFFVYLNQKQNSRSSIAHYQQQPVNLLRDKINKITALTSSFLSCENLEEFNLLVEIHETLISSCITIPKIKSRLFPDFPGAIKSLGGWGGDFILATGGEAEKHYFQNKGYKTILSYDDMVK